MKPIKLDCTEHGKDIIPNLGTYNTDKYILKIVVTFNGTKIQNLEQAVDYYKKMLSVNDPDIEQFKNVIKLFC